MNDFPKGMQTKEINANFVKEMYNRKKREAAWDHLKEMQMR